MTNPPHRTEKECASLKEEFDTVNEHYQRTKENVRYNSVCVCVSADVWVGGCAGV